MALYGARWGAAYGVQHVGAVMVKVPMLFLLTLVVTVPSLHVFAALARSRLVFGQTVRLLLAATALALVVLASFAPVTAFFTFSTKSHPFMQLLNATLFTASGLIGLRFVWKRLGEALVADAFDRALLEQARADETEDEVEAACEVEFAGRSVGTGAGPGTGPGTAANASAATLASAKARPPRSAASPAVRLAHAGLPEPRVGWVFLAWFVIYGSVAAQMGWLLRPFVGSPNLPQTLFRQTEHNIFWGLAEALQYLD